MASSTPQCYYPNGNAAYTHTPCNASATESWCCSVEDFCLNNGHCLQETDDFPNRIARGSCTDRAWNSKTCPFECADGMTTLPPTQSFKRGSLADDGDTVVKKYMDITLHLAWEIEESSSPFCCDKPYNNETQACGVSSRGDFNPFQLPVGRVVYNRDDGSVMMNGSLPSDLFQHDACEVQTVTIQNQATQTLGPTTCPQAEPANVTAIAAGIAVPLGVLFLASLVAVAVLFRQNRSLKSVAQAQKPSTGDLAEAQVAFGAGFGKPGMGDYGKEGAYGHSPVKELSNDRALVESGGRPVVPELSVRAVGE